ncbi:hypothetical protein BD560DRAFT_430263 [Blakeslea trispora]|nr:hypothetical protein BD560DRAFT_430263 [Blakeslea trispora]
MTFPGELDDNEAIDYAQRIWDEDVTAYDDLEHIVEWIGDGKPSSDAILKAYFNHFDFKGLSLEQAFRNVCSKLHLKGETQQIDRILSRFAQHYFTQNPKIIFGSKDAVHAIVYSLMLLNTDLHVAQGDYKRMTRSAFVRNTMDAIYNQLSIPTGIDENSVIEEHKGNAISFSTFEWSNLQRTPSSSSNFSSRSSTYTPSLDSSISSGSQITIGSKSWQLEVKNLLKQMYSNIRHCQISDPSLPPSNTNHSQRVSTVLKRSMGTIMWRGSRHFSSNNSSCIEDGDSASSTIAASISSSCLYANSLIQYQSLASHLQTELPMIYTSSAPYYKEGLVIRKHLLEKTNQKAKHRDWRECFMVIERSQLRMYKLDYSHNEPRKRSLIRNTLMNRNNQTSQIHTPFSEGHDAIGGGDWLSNALLIGLIDLKHALANVLPSGYSKQRQNAFALQQSSGAIHVFQVGSEVQVHEWVSTCNYWAARESKEPMSEGVSSMDYGWNCLELDLETPMIHEWQAPIPPSVSSLLEESTQLDVLQKHVQKLAEELDQHRDIKPKMEDRFANSKLFTKVLTNWERKSCYLLHEIIKYQNYCDSIEKSLALQTKFKSL